MKLNETNPVTIFSLIVSAISFLYYLSIPLTDDVRVFISAAMNADRYGLDAAWEVKTIGNKALFYTIWHTFQWVPEDYFVFTMKLFVGIVVLAICWYFAKKVQEVHGNNPFFVFAIVCTGLFLIHPFCIFQSEWFAVIGSLLALGIIFENTEYCSHFGFGIAGVIMGMIGFLKLSTFLMIIPVIIAWILLAGKKNVSIWDITQVIEGFIGMIFIGFTICLIAFPHAIPDMILSIDLVQANQIRPVNADWVTALSTGIISTPLDVIPILLATVVSVILAGILYFGNKEGRKPYHGYLMLIIMWGASFAGAFAAREFFAYHYMPLVLPAIITLILVREDVVVLGILCSMIMASLYIVPQFGELSGYMNFLKHADSDSKEMKTIVGGEPELLYLDYGEAPFYLRVPNACRYTYPLPVQRNLSGDASNEVIKCIQDYRGRYVITQPWLESISINQTVTDYLKNSTLVFNKTWQIYRRNVT
jgi:hypothetical protein